MTGPVCAKCGNDGTKGGLFLTIDARYDPAVKGWVLEQRDDSGGQEIDCLACDHRTPEGPQEDGGPEVESGFPYDMVVFAVAPEGEAAPPVEIASPPTKFFYSPWRKGGWYVDNVRYPSGACGCVSRNYADGKWRIACHPRASYDDAPTFKTRDEAALAEWHLTQQEART